MVLEKEIKCIMGGWPGGGGGEGKTFKKKLEWPREELLW